ncbi:hypothetical protein SUGI_1062010 [Cryptomeria japonica]|nr:hypothetical protein SUGI_1062010 [Cryptomeria japonica]
MEDQWKGLKLILTILNFKKADSKKVSWRKPRGGWYKLNFNDVTKGNPGDLGFGTFIRSGDGKMVATVRGYIGVATNNEAEMLALKKGLRLCKECNIDKIQIERDSQFLINAIWKDHILNWKLKQWIPSIKKDLEQFVEFSLAHVYHEENKVTK